jgi:single-strand DNA-binding protein
MMSSFQQITILGNVGKDPEIRYTPNGTACANLTVATSRQWKSQDGEKHEETEWHRLSAFGRQAEVLGEYVRKGNRIFVTGYMKTRKWQDKDGVDRYTTEVMVESFKLIDRHDGGGSSEAAAERPAAKQKPKPAAPANDDDIPF